ncbi:MAG: hypothetical protein H6Q78_1606, partial [Candidatus Krumholzibacteriota bacterium]|nr:hypothetical protein [Candidatus Krumholzibacteriota bacterium]
LVFRPGSGFSYSNENYDLLAAIVETASGATYEQYVRDHILRRARMEETRFWEEAGSDGECAVASMKQKPLVAPGTRDWGYIGSGGMFSTVGDLHRWFIALIDGDLIPKDDLRLMWSRQWKAGSTGIAFGWFLTEASGQIEIWTRGNESWGHNAVVRWFPEKRILVVVETNSGELDDKNATGNRVISNRIVDILLGPRGH